MLGGRQEEGRTPGFPGVLSAGAGGPLARRGRGGWDPGAGGGPHRSRPSHPTGIAGAESGGRLNPRSIASALGWVGRLSGVRLVGVVRARVDLSRGAGI